MNSNFSQFTLAMCILMQYSEEQKVETLVPWQVSHWTLQLFGSLRQLPLLGDSGIYKIC